MNGSNRCDPVIRATSAMPYLLQMTQQPNWSLVLYLECSAQLIRCKGTLMKRLSHLWPYGLAL